MNEEDGEEDLFSKNELDGIFSGDDEALTVSPMQYIRQETLTFDSPTETHQQQQPQQQSRRSDESYESLRAFAESAFVPAVRPHQPWHNPKRDKLERQTLIIDIYYLLHTHEEEPVTQTWLKEMPYRVRKLERFLYNEAASIEEYRNRDTLMQRVERVARELIAKFLQKRRNPTFKRKAAYVNKSYEDFCSPSNLSSAVVQTANNRDSSLRDLLLSHYPQGGYGHGAPEGLQPRFSQSLHTIHASNMGDLTGPSVARGHMEFASENRICYQSTLLTEQQVPSGLLPLPSTSSQTSFDVEANTFEMRQFLTSQLLTQQQQIIDNIRQQEKLIQQLQQSRLSQQNQTPVFMMGSLSNLPSPSRRILSPNCFAAGQRQVPHSSSGNQEHFIQSSAVGLQSSNQQLRMASRHFLQYQQGQLPVVAQSPHSLHAHESSMAPTTSFHGASTNRQDFALAHEASISIQPINNSVFSQCNGNTPRSPPSSTTGSFRHHQELNLRQRQPLLIQTVPNSTSYERSLVTHLHSPSSTNVKIGLDDIVMHVEPSAVTEITAMKHSSLLNLESSDPKQSKTANRQYMHHDIAGGGLQGRSEGSFGW